MEGRDRVRSSARLSADRRRSDVAAAAVAAATAAAAEARAAAAAAERAARRARAAARQAEIEDSPRVFRKKCRILARAIRNAKHLVVYTGAGVSTAASIPDYRGPRGVWTRLRRGEAAPRVDVAAARPTFTHRALAALGRAGRLRFLVSQNCDGLHLRAGTPRRALAELHGDMFLERCAHCRRVYARDFDTSARTRRHAHGTRRLCHLCGRELRDTIVHFGERGRAAWPLNWAGALRHAAAADVVLCLGSSLKVLRRYPRLWNMQRPPARRPRLYIVNLQWTPKDSVATLKINARCDAVMAAVARRLRLAVPRYSARRDPLRAHATPLAPPERHTLRRAPRPFLSDSSAPSASSADSDDDRPLTHFARDPPRPPPPPPTPYTTFQVQLRNSEATIMLRTEHASSLLPEPPPPPPPSALRQFRIARHRGGRGGCGGGGGGAGEDDAPLSELAAAAAAARDIIARALLHCRATLYPGLHTVLPPKRESLKQEPSDWEPLKLELSEREPLKLELSKREPFKLEQSKREPLRLEPSKRVSLDGSGEARAVQCHWCMRHYAADKCLWYQPLEPLRGRAWRSVRGKRYLCACCPREHDERDAPDLDVDAPGWYGKGYRKWRRKR